MNEPYEVIYADPPWQYKMWRGKDASRVADHNYPRLSVGQICALRPLAAKNAVLFLWATVPLLRDALVVMDSWVLQLQIALRVGQTEYRVG